MLGMHKAIPFDRYDPPEMENSKHRINIVKKVGDGDETQMIAEGLTLKEVYQNYIEPGKILEFADVPPRGKVPLSLEELERLGTVREYNNYSISAPHAENVTVNIKQQKLGKKARQYAPKIKDLGMLREIHLMMTTPREHFREMMDKAYQFIELGCPVEFDIVIKHVKESKFAKLRKLQEDSNIFHYMHQHFPHLRPDFIRKSMPPGTTYLIHPFSDGRHVQFVLALGDKFRGKNYTARFLRVKEGVQMAIKEGKARQLPRTMRFELIQNGDTNYSLSSGVPRLGFEDSVQKTDKEKWTAGGKHSRYMDRENDRKKVPLPNYIGDEKRVQKWDGENTKKKRYIRDEDNIRKIDEERWRTGGKHPRYMDRSKDRKKRPLPRYIGDGDSVQKTDVERLTAEGKYRGYVERWNDREKHPLPRFEEVPNR